MFIRSLPAIRKPRAAKPKPKPKPKVQGKTESKPSDPLADIQKSRLAERTEIVKARLQLDKLRLDTQRAILASRAKFHAARWKMINKSMDD
jgi:hypothetical protein